MIGRAEEIEQAVEILCRRHKNNPVLIGEAGVGKTAIVEGLAQRITDDDVPPVLAGRRVIQLEPSSLVAGTRFRGDFEERLRRLMDEIRDQGCQLIVFIDELHTLIGAGSGIDGGLDAASIFKPALARGEINVIGATTMDEYRRSIEKDPPLARRFQPVQVPEPSADDTLAMLRGLRELYEEHHQVWYTTAPTGVGKTELARALTQSLFGTEDRMIRLDMSEFAERHTVSRLTGSPPGYVGYEDAGQLTEAVRRRPYSLVLLDEIEKAHPDALSILLQILDDGRLTDGQGQTVDFTNTVLIMTSNLGSELLTGRSGALGFAGRAADSADGHQASMQDRLGQRLRESFRPEFLNRIDEIIVFRRLGPPELAQISALLLEQTRHRLSGQGVTAEFTPATVAWIAERGYQPELGARPMRRTIQREVDNELSRLLLSDQVTAGQQVTVHAEDGQLTFSVRAPVVCES